MEFPETLTIKVQITARADSDIVLNEGKEKNKFIEKRNLDKIFQFKIDLILKQNS